MISRAGLPIVLATLALLTVSQTAAPHSAAETMIMQPRPLATHYGTETIDGLGLFYRKAGPVDAPLHGFPSSSHMFRNPIPPVADHYHVIPLDYPCFGNGAMSDDPQFAYMFEPHAELVDALLVWHGTKTYAMYVVD